MSGNFNVPPCGDYYPEYFEDELDPMQRALDEYLDDVPMAHCAEDSQFRTEDLSTAGDDQNEIQQGVEEG